MEYGVLHNWGPRDTETPRLTGPAILDRHGPGVSAQIAEPEILIQQLGLNQGSGAPFLVPTASFNESFPQYLELLQPLPKYKRHSSGGVPFLTLSISGFLHGAGQPLPPPLLSLAASEASGAENVSLFKGTRHLQTPSAFGKFPIESPMPGASPDV